MTRWQEISVGVALCSLGLVPTGCSWTDPHGTHLLIVGMGRHQIGQPGRLHI